MLFTKKKVTDPVCGMEVKVGSSTLRSVINEKEYYFCSAACQVKFESDPQKYVANSKEGLDGANHCHKEHQHHGHCNNAQEHNHQCCGKHNHSHH
jgi:Cu+-exporting ATPase